MPAAACSLDPTSAAIVEALAYADVFGWPLTAEEIHRYLPVAARPGQVTEALASRPLAGQVGSVGGLYFLRGREHLVAERQQKAELSERLWPHAISYGRVLAALPWVRLVAVTGSLAVGAVTDDADIDLLIVAEDGRLWLSRGLTIGVAKIAARVPATRGVRLCPNYLLTASALDLPERDLYTAHELAQLVPLHGPDVYRALLERNGWYRHFVPNHIGHGGPIPQLRGRRRNRVLEPALQNRVVGRIERWEMERKIAKLGTPSTTDEVRFDESICKGHFEGYREAVLAAFESRLIELRVAGL